tara:strand:- start:1894 stop:2319 length:426 start_codon:yes stop_codon:yes gene_type:complete
MTPRKKRILVVCMMIAGISVAALLILTAFEKNLMYFYSPTEIINGEAPQSRSFRIGGLVVSDTVIRNPDDLKVSFVLTDTVHEIKVIYDGILPDLFREGQGIVANGKLKSENVFVADEVLAKHDENYMPPEVADALEKSWR